MKNATGWTIPSIIILGDLDSIALANKLKMIKQDKKSHPWIQNELDRNYAQYLFYYIKHVYDIKASNNLIF